MRLPVTYLFAPGNRPQRFAKALASEADAIILDLEDSVAPAGKGAARNEIVRWLESLNDTTNVLVRINDRQSPWFEDDLVLLRDCKIRCVMLPKTESVDDIQAALAVMPDDSLVVPLIETARGVQNVNAIAGAAGVKRLAFGTIDYAVDMHLSGDERGLIYPASQIAMASRCAGIAPPIAGVTLAIDDTIALLVDLGFARSLGFGAKMCIHPTQVTTVRKAMMPTASELDWARRVVEAAADGPGAVLVNGSMIDRPALLKAEDILAREVKR